MKKLLLGVFLALGCLLHAWGQECLSWSYSGLTLRPCSVSDQTESVPSLNALVDLYARVKTGTCCPLALKEGGFMYQAASRSTLTTSVSSDRRSATDEFTMVLGKFYWWGIQYQYPRGPVLAGERGVLLAGFRWAF